MLKEISGVYRVYSCKRKLFKPFTLFLEPNMQLDSEDIMRFAKLLSVDLAKFEVLNGDQAVTSQECSIDLIVFVPGAMDQVVERIYRKDAGTLVWIFPEFREKIWFGSMLSLPQRMDLVDTGERPSMFLQGSVIGAPDANIYVELLSWDQGEADVSSVALAEPRCEDSRIFKRKRADSNRVAGIASTSAGSA